MDKVKVKETAGGSIRKERPESSSFELPTRSERESLRNLLDLSSERLYGRDREEEQLLRAYKRAMDSSNCELVLISGLSGTGKTTLAHNTLRKQRAHVISGKFEETKQPPYAVFVKALTDYVEKLSVEHSELIPSLKMKIDEMVSDEAGLLIQLIPALSSIMGKSPAPKSPRVSLQAARFKYSFSNLIHSMASIHPLVVLLDDVTWADGSSIDIVESLLLLQEKDKPLSLMLVGTHRPLDESSSLSKLLNHLDDNRVTEIPLCEWHVDSVNEFVSDILSRDRTETLPLATQVHSQTKGNIFYVLQYLRLLEEQRLLCYDSSEQKWVWDSRELESTSGSELLQLKLERLPSEVQETLKVATCMGNVVDESALSIVFNGEENVASSLEQAAAYGLLISSQDGLYKFGHDRIRQAISSLIQEPDQFHLDIGRKLWDCVKDDNVFMVATLLNRGSRLIVHKHERYRLAELNLKAGLKAISLSAFLDASFYLNSGVDLLPPSHWQEDYRLSLELFDTASEVEMLNAHFERVKTLITQVLEHATTLHDMMRSYTTLMSSVGQQDDLEHAMGVGFEVLNALGHPLPRNATKWNTGKDFLRTKWMMRNMTIEDFCSLPLMTDERMVWCSEVLNLLSIYAVLSRSKHAPIIALRTIQLCLRHGLSRGSSWAFAFYGMAFVVTGNVLEGERLSKVALAVLDASGAREMLPKVYAFVYSGLYHWTRPLRDTLEPLKFASRVGMEVGDVEHSMLAINRYVVHCFYSGHPLSTIEDDYKEYARLMKAYKQENCLISFNLIGQIIHNLTGRAADPSVLKGEILDIDNALRETKEMHSRAIQASCLQYSALMAFMFGDYERAHEILESLTSTVGSVNCFWGKVTVCYLRGLAAIALARKHSSAKKSYVRIAKGRCTQMSTWAKNCPSNFAHKQKLLEAELYGTIRDSGSSVRALKLYDVAIELANQQGVIQDEALGNELAAEYLDRAGESMNATVYRNRARSLYLEWGATAKAALLS